jgi:hypothetical protein
VAIRGLADLVVQCTAFSPDHRPSFAAILQVPGRTARPCKPVHTLQMLRLQCQEACPAVHRVHAHGHIEQQQVASKSPTRVAGPLQTLDHIWSTFSAAAEARPSLAEASPNRIAGALLGQTPPRGGVAQLLRGHSCVLLQSLLSCVMPG